jgi:hypothetical protein
MPAGPQPLQIMMAPFPEGFSCDLDQQWQQGVQLLQGTVIVSGSTTPTRLFFWFPTLWPVHWKGTLDQTWAKGVSLMQISTIPRAAAHDRAVPADFQGTLETCNGALN